MTLHATSIELYSIQYFYWNSIEIQLNRNGMVLKICLLLLSFVTMVLKENNLKKTPFHSIQGKV
jgi:hypothetical protein